MDPAPLDLGAGVHMQAIPWQGGRVQLRIHLGNLLTLGHAAFRTIRGRHDIPSPRSQERRFDEAVAEIPNRNHCGIEDCSLRERYIKVRQAHDVLVDERRRSEHEKEVQQIDRIRVVARLAK